MDFQITDVNYQSLRVPEDVLADTNIVIINTTGFSNAELAELFVKLNESSPAVIGLDKILKAGYNDSSDIALAGELARTKNLVMTSKLFYNSVTKKYDSILYSDGLFRQYGKCGFSNIMLRGNVRFETVREFASHLEIGDSTYFSFAAMITMFFDKKSFEILKQRDNETELIDFRGKFDKYYYTEASSVIKDEVDINLFRGKVVLLSDANALDSNFIFEKKFYTPLNENTTGRAIPDMYDIEIQANIISMIIQKNYFNSISSVLAIIIAFIICYLNMQLYRFMENKIEKWYELLSLSSFVIESSLLLLIGYYVYHNYMFELKLSYVLFTLILSTMIFEAYTKSIKPLSVEFINKFFKR
ncbi:MAG: CHASE2 domain-containing protein [Bacteroidota bacterium]